MSENGGFFNGLIFQDPLDENNYLKFVFDNKINKQLGSGIYPVCPAYYIDDFLLATQNKLGKKGFINKKGRFSKDIGKPF